MKSDYQTMQSPNPGPTTVGGSNPAQDYSTQGNQHDMSGYSRGISRYSDYRVEGPDQRNYSVSGAGNEYSDQMHGYARDAMFRPGYQMGAINDGGMQAYLSQLQRTASGQAPSMAAVAAAQQNKQGMANQQALANGVQGGAGSVLAMRGNANAQAAGQMQGQQAMQQAALQERLGAQQQLGQALGQSQALGLQQAQMSGQQSLGNLQSREQAVQAYMRMGLDAQTANQQAMSDYENARLYQEKINRDTASANAHGKSDNNASGLVGAVGSVLGAIF